jgi:Zn-dependent M28 family amino/carboxypeptidase
VLPSGYRPIPSLFSAYMRKTALLIVVSLTFLYAFQPARGLQTVPTASVRAALDGIRPDSLRGDLSFIASDLLEGRDTPSRGLDVAAGYIAAQFRRAGLEPGGNDGFFQTAEYAVLESDSGGFGLSLSEGDRRVSIGPQDVALDVSAAMDLTTTPVFKVDMADAALIQALTPRELDGKVVVTELRRDAMTNYRLAARKLREATPAAVITIDRTGMMERTSRRLVDPAASAKRAPRIVITTDAVSKFYAALRPGLNGATATIHIAAPHRTAAQLRNLIGILRGSDPALKDTCVLLTAHYDHLGVKPDGSGDRIYNGANDDGSGTVSVIEIARALSRLTERPRRSIVFMTFFGEEKGLVGSSYYAQHPAWPIVKTVAQLNLEQVGRTDSSEGQQLSNASVTGFDYSDVTDYLVRAGAATGIKVYKNPKASDQFFTASDNYPLAEAGVPAHSLCVAFEFKDYHAVGDEWQKIDYDNMAKVDRMIAFGMILMANSAESPHWKAENPKAAPFLKALKELRK